MRHSITHSNGLIKKTDLKISKSIDYDLLLEYYGIAARRKPDSEKFMVNCSKGIDKIFTRTIEYAIIIRESLRAVNEPNPNIPEYQL